MGMKNRSVLSYALVAKERKTRKNKKSSSEKFFGLRASLSFYEMKIKPQTSLEKAIDRAVYFLQAFFPLKNYLLYPLLFAASIWALRRRKKWKEEILSFRVWLDPGVVETKPDDYILHFFSSHPGLRKAYQDELRANDLRALRKDFKFLYPVVGLEDPFLKALFSTELESGDFRLVAREFEVRVSRAWKEIEMVEDRPSLIRGLGQFVREMADLSLFVLSEDSIQELIASRIKECLEKKDE